MVGITTITSINKLHISIMVIPNIIPIVYFIVFLAYNKFDLIF